MQIFFFAYLGLCLLSIQTFTNADISRIRSNLAVSPLLETGDWNAIIHCSSVTCDVPEEEETALKNELCRTIVASQLISETFRVFPIEGNRSRIIANGSLIQGPNNITGRYSLREISLNGVTYHNFVFPCMSWNYDANKFVEIFISRQLPTSHLFEDTPGGFFRLVFEQDEEGKLIAKAIAENVAKSSSFSISRKEVHQFWVSHNDSICHLSTNMKIRLCTIILNAAVKSNNWSRQFPSYAYDIEPQCEKIGVWFVSDDHSRVGLAEVWTVKCKAMGTSGVNSFNQLAEAFIFRCLHPESFCIGQEVNKEEIVVLPLQYFLN